MRRAQRPRLVGEVLISDGHITEEDLSKALAEQKSAGRMLGEVLVDQGTISGGTLVQSLAKCLGVPGVQLRHGLIDPAAADWERGGRAPLRHPAVPSA